MIICDKCGDNAGPFVLLRGPGTFLCEDCWEKRIDEIYETAREFSKKEKLHFIERIKNETANIRNRG